VDRVWDAFWSGGIANPLEVIEQITYLLFLRRLDELQTLAENKANRTGKPLERVIFDGGGTDSRRWKNFKQADPTSMFATERRCTTQHCHKFSGGSRNPRRMCRPSLSRNKMASGKVQYSNLLL